MKKTFLYISVLFFSFHFMFFSCSSGEGAFIADEEGTLRSQTDALESSISWSEEIETDRLVKKIDIPEDVASGVKLSPLSVSARVYESSPDKKYPFLSGFTSLDTRNMPQQVKENTVKFCESVKTCTEADSFMASSSLYELALFNNDLDEYFPLKKDDENPDAITEKSRFDYYYIGMETLMNSECEVPVRFIKGKSFLDLTVYFVFSEDSWKIDGFDFVNWENADGN